ncbi:MAG: exodeoxyribonuclease V subunit beta [Proteobacteria bacterium]|nr:exodeoxyribonuclease V subunit beta [Pseudomonadota bacterium]
MITNLNQFDILTSSLEGTNLIEASAGTGKTYAITGLFLRLILERNYSINEILVVTFTEAATEELKDRIRSKLREAIGAFTGVRSDDAFLKNLVKEKDSKKAIPRLREALRGFDQASIFTIHGFCRRMLHDYAFESGSLFDTELVSDQENLKREIVDDFWRRHFYEASPLFVNYALNNKFSPDSLLSLLAGRFAHPYLKIIPQLGISDISHHEREFQASFNELANAWKSARATVKKIFTTHEGLNRNRYRKHNIPLWIQNMDYYAASRGHDPISFKGFEKFTESGLKGSMKKGYAPPVHPFFECCERHKQRQEALAGAFEQRLLGLKAGLFHYAEQELDRSKKEQNIQSFDDLLLKLHRALEGKGGETLARSIREKFRAALIDEFQDTDPIQYAIFKKVFATEDRILFLIGDPKQAIYSFRGADIFAYMEAAEEVASRYTLRENWRSQPDLIKAINAIFVNKAHPFVYGEILFHPARPAPKKDSELFRLNGQSEPPFQLWLLNADKGKPISKTQARKMIPEAVAGEISRLLELGRKNRALLGKRPLLEGDIAVLVRTNDEARLMQESLSTLHIPSVLYSTGNLFDSHEALEMERVLTGIIDPNNERIVRAALTTDMLGVSGEKLDCMMRDETGWENWLAKFKLCHDIWEERGFFRMFRYLILEESVLPRLMSFPDGERRNTNLLHLSEVLHQRAIEEKLRMAGLLKWLSEQREGKTTKIEEHPLRLESDEKAVKLITIHKSKGLEYPVVFCPFAWGGSRIKKSKEPFMFHNESDNRRLTLDIGSESRDENRVFAEKEILAEDLRLLYVALTRAKNRCYLVWGRFNEADTSAPAYLLHQPGLCEGGNVVSAAGERFNSLSDEDVITELKTLSDKSGGTISLSEMPVGAAKEHSPLLDKKVALTCREFAGKIDREWRIASFSTLVSGSLHGDERADRDAISLAGGYEQEDSEGSSSQKLSSSIFSFPRGTKAGTFMHDILEHLDFEGKDDSSIKKLVIDKLEKYSFEIIWQDTICTMINKVLSVSLDRKRKDFILSSIPIKDRVSELEFYFPLRSISPEKLKSIFLKYAGVELPSQFPEQIERLHFLPARGFMKGFIDLIFQFDGAFYLVDWKSNFLGSRVEDYGRESLAEVMKEKYYILQYHIYTVALNQYLSMRFPDYNYNSHFGGVYYIFLRGVDPEKGPDFGIYRTKPSEKLINELSRSLIAHSN